MRQQAGYTPNFNPDSAFTTEEIVFIQNLATDAGNDATQVLLRSENWQMDTTPTGTVNGTNTDFTIAANASQVVVYADGLRVKGGGVDYSHTTNTTAISFVSGRQPYSAISVDYLPT